MPYPCTGFSATAVRISRSSVPCGRSDFGVAIYTSIFYGYGTAASHRSARGMARPTVSGHNRGMQRAEINRRGFLRASAIAGTACTVSSAESPQAATEAAHDVTRRLAAWAVSSRKEDLPAAIRIGRAHV